MSTSHLVLILAVVAAQTAAQSDQEDRNLQVVYDTWVNMTCADEIFQPAQSPSAMYQWVHPSGEPIGTSDEHYLLEESGSILIIQGVKRPDFGTYLCVISLPGSPVYHVVRWGLNLDGPFYGDPWEKYWPRGKIGLFAGLAVFCFMSMLCINLEQFDCHHDKTDKIQQNSPPSGFRLEPYHPSKALYTDSSTFLYSNPAFVDDMLTTDNLATDTKDSPAHRDETPTHKDDTSTHKDNQEAHDVLEGNSSHGLDEEPKTSF